MSGEVLSAADRAYFLKMMRRQLPSTVHRRMNVLLLLDDGWPARRVAEALYLDETTVSDHRRRYARRGRAGIEQLDYVGQEPALDDEQLRALSEYVDTTLPQTSKELAAWVEDQFGVTYTANAMTKLLKRLGFVYKKPKCVPAKADAEEQQRFVEEVLDPLMEEAGEEAPLYFVDATHPAHTGRPAHGWIRKGAVRELKSNHGRTRLNINGALCWHNHAIIHRQEDKITADAMIALFEEIEARHPAVAPGAVAVVIDNARYNLSRKVKDWFARDGCRLRPIYLPSYAPNLNMIERFWRLMKSKVLANRYYPTQAAFRQAFEDFFEERDRWQAELKTLLSPKFHVIGVPENGIL